MNHKRLLKRLMAMGLLSAILVQVTACGYLFWPERRNQSATDRIDPAVAILDSLGFFLFIIPGVVAFIVDFNTHTIYLPSDRQSSGKMIALHTPGDRLTTKGVEKTVSEYVGRTVNLESDEVRIYPIDDLRQFQTGLSDIP